MFVCVPYLELYIYVLICTLCEYIYIIGRPEMYYYIYVAASEFHI